MKINKDGITEENHEYALRILQEIRDGSRCIGNPAEGLHQTLIELEKKQNKEVGETEFSLTDKKLASEIAKVKSGIVGEETLAEYLQKLLKLNSKLNNIIVFSSLSYEIDNNDKDYIPDTDFIAVYGTNIMVIDAKNITTTPEVPIYLEDGVIKTPTKELIEVRPSTYLWEKIFKKNDIQYNSIDGCVCIINKNGATIYKNQEWYASHTKLIHISELEKYLSDWIDRCGEDSSTLSLKMLTQIGMTQIRKESSGLDLSKMKTKFGV